MAQYGPQKNDSKNRRHRPEIIFFAVKKPYQQQNDNQYHEDVNVVYQLSESGIDKF
jgi:hypothetical protein